ncbi:MAG TPA: nuclear transport factor 2 family protein [Caulobacteraceae bacterium]|jgi:ketosteroid isomerase-like protein
MADSRKTESKADSPVVLARRWVSALNARDASVFETLLAPDFTYAGMARTPPELGVRWDREIFVSKVVRGAGVMAKPVVMTIVSELEAGERAVLETEGHGIRTDGGVYANVYCLMFWTQDGRVTAVHDYCCTATAFAHFERLTDAPAAAQGRG